LSGQGSRLQSYSNDRIKSHIETLETGVAGIFSGGDCITGPATVVEAIGAGRRAALSIDRYLRQGQVTAARKPYNCSKGELSEVDPADILTLPLFLAAGCRY